MLPNPVDREWCGVVVGLDETDQGRCAVRWAATQAATHGCPLHVVSVLELATPVVAGWAPTVFCDARQRVGAQEWLLGEVETCRDEFPGLEVHGTLHDGRAGARLAEYADQVGANLVAVGGSSRGWLSRSLLGSTAEELVRTHDGPVVVVRDPTPVQQAGALLGQAPVVAAIEGIEAGEPVLDFAFDAAAHGGTAVAVVASEPQFADVLTELDEHLDRWRLRYPRVTATIDIAGHAPRQTLLERAETAQLLVVRDEHRPGPVKKLLHGSTCSALLRHAPCTVAVIGSGGLKRAGPARGRV